MIFFIISSNQFGIPKQDSNLGPRRIAIFEDCKATALKTQPPGLNWETFYIKLDSTCCTFDLHLNSNKTFFQKHFSQAALKSCNYVIQISSLKYFSVTHVQDESSKMPLVFVQANGESYAIQSCRAMRML